MGRGERGQSGRQERSAEFGEQWGRGDEVRVWELGEMARMEEWEYRRGLGAPVE